MTITPKFFNFTQKDEGTVDAAKEKTETLPLGLKLAQEVKMSPHQTPTYSTTQTNSPTPRGDNVGDVGADVDF